MLILINTPPLSPPNQCVQLVNKYAPEIIDAILSGAAAKTVCTLIHLCALEEKQLVAVKGNGEGACCFRGNGGTFFNNDFFF